MKAAAIIHFIVYFAARCLLLLLRGIPKSASIRLAQGLATVVYTFDGRHKKIARVNLAIAFPELSSQQREELIVGSYRNLGRLAAELSRFPSLNSSNIDQVVRYDDSLGLQHYFAARSKGRGVLFLTGHFGCWELLPYAHALYGHPLSFLVRPLDNAYLESYLNRLRESCGNQTIPKRSSIRTMLEVLSKGGSVGILIDQNVMPSEGGFVPLFGKLACTTTGMARLALKTGAPVVPGRIQWCERENRYRILFWPELPLIRTGDKEQDVLDNTRLFNQTIEQMIRIEPESWLWGHKRWNARPPEDPANPYTPF